MPNRIHPLQPSPVGAGRVHAPGTGHTHGPGTPEGPRPTHPKTLERIGPLAGLASRSTPPAAQGQPRPRAELPASRDPGRSWMSSLTHAASKTGHAISHGFHRAGHALHKFGQVRNEPHAEPAWMRHMSEEERGHFDYHGELPAESSHAPHSSRPSPYVAPPWEQPERVQVRHRLMTDREQAAENAQAQYHGHEPRSMVEEYVSRPASRPSGVPWGASPGTVRTRPMTASEQAAESGRAQYHNEVPRTTIDEFVPQRPTPAPRRADAGRDALLANIRETVPRMNLARLNHAEPREFVQFAQNLARGTRYEQAMLQRARTDPALAANMKDRWLALQGHLNGLRAQGAENVPSAQWLFEHRGVRMMAFLVDGNGGSKLVRPTTQR
jgi:hypothetical protein